MKFYKLEELQHLSTISIEEAAYLVGVSRTKAYEEARHGTLFETVTCGKRIRVKARPLFNVLMGSALDEMAS